MKKDTVRTVMLVVGVLFLLAVLGLASAVWLFTRSVNVGTADEADATRSFDEVRSRFAGSEPILRIENETPVVTRRPPSSAPGAALSSLRILAWDPDDGSLARIDVPFWLLRLKSGPIEIVTDQTVLSDSDLGITVEELERFGPTLVLDHEAVGGDRVIVWTQ